MPQNIPNPLNVVVLRDEDPSAVDRIQAIDPDRVRVTRLSDRDPDEPGSDKVFREGHVALVGPRCPKDLHARMPGLLWVHAAFAGITDLNGRDFWGTDVIMTSARGQTGALPIAEMALVGGLMIAKDLHFAARNKTTRNSGREAFHPWLVSNKTIGIIGLGGIGADLARLAKGLGMTVLATRRSAEVRTKNVDGVDEIFPPSMLKEMAAQSHFLAICTASTPETHHMVNGGVLDSLPDDGIIMNVARGEVIDEEAMIARLEAGKLGGAYLDVYTAERERDPDPRLQNHPNVVMTPHIADRSDTYQHFALDIFCDNLRRLLAGDELVNVVDWERGY